MRLNRGTPRRRQGLVAAAALTVAVALGVLPASASPPNPSSPAGTVTSLATGPSPASQAAQYSCGLPAPGHATCLSIVNPVPITPPVAGQATGDGAVDGPYERPNALFAPDLQDAYNLPAAVLGARQTIAVVAAFDNPNAEEDLAVYRKENGLPPCTSDFPCFRKVDQRGGTQFPAPDVGWALEISLDLQMASAACPNCQLLLVEADDNSLDNLGLAVDTAVRLGADVVTNSYGTTSEFAGQMDYAKHYDHPGTVILAASGDLGFGIGVPAAYSSVVAVGGTTLFRGGGERGWTETVWVGSGSGCSAYVPKPSWQRDWLCSMRSVADVAAVADPVTPVAVYDTFGLPGWIGVGGTSAASPLVAGMYALAANTGNDPAAARLYARASHNRGGGRDLFDVGPTTFPGFPDANGACGGSYLCRAVTGYDGPTGVGSPNGIGAL